MFAHSIKGCRPLGRTCGVRANTFPARKYNSRAFHLKVRRSRLFRFFRRFPQINVGGDSARIPFVEHTFSSNKRWWRLRAFSFLGRRTLKPRVALPPKGRLRQLATPLGTCFLRVRPFNFVQCFTVTYPFVGFLSLCSCIYKLF